MRAITGTVLEDPRRSMITLWILLRIRKFSDKHTEYLNTHFMYNNYFFLCRSSYSLWDTVAKYGRAR